MKPVLLGCEVVKLSFFLTKLHSKDHFVANNHSLGGKSNLLSSFSAFRAHQSSFPPPTPPVKLMSLKFIQTRKSKHLFCATSSWKKKIRIIRINEQVGNKNLQLIEVTPHQVNTMMIK